MSTTFRLAHISDTHIGYRAHNRVDPDTGRNQRTVDTERAFTRLIDDILARHVDGVIHSGDVFHHSRPTWQSLRFFIREMRRLEQAGIPTIVIAGNHDTPRIRTGGSVYSVLELALPHIDFVAEFEDAPFLKTFAEASIAVHAIPHGALTNPDPVFASPQPGLRNILTLHGLAPGVMPEGVLSEPGEQIFDHHLLDSRFDYIALGHIHQAQQITANAWYAGSSERFGWNDLAAVPGYNLVRLADGVPEVERVELPARPMVGLPHISGAGRDGRTIADVILGRIERLQNPEAMVRIDVRDCGRPIRREVQAILRREAGAFVWLIELTPERSLFQPRLIQPDDPDESLDLHVLFREFVSQRRAGYPSDEFTTSFLERGSRALADAIAAESTPSPEEDNLA